MIEIKFGKQFAIIFLSMIIILANSCKQEKKEINQNISNQQRTLAKDSTTSISDEFFIGKIFYAGDELNQFEFIKSGDFKKEDSLQYSIYKKINKNAYVFSVEKFLSNVDQEEFEIIDLIGFKNYSRSMDINSEIVGNNVTISFGDQKQLIKKWQFPIKQKHNILNEEKVISTIKEFYSICYGKDLPETEDAVFANYLSPRMMRRIEQLRSSPEGNELDYDPFIQGQDYDHIILKNSLEVKHLRGNEYRASFIQFGWKSEQRTYVDYVLVEKEGKYLIDAISNDENLNFKNSTQ